jgi:hypothetical protein
MTTCIALTNKNGTVLASDTQAVRNEDKARVNKQSSFTSCKGGHEFSFTGSGSLFTLQKLHKHVDRYLKGSGDISLDTLCDCVAKCMKETSSAIKKGELLVEPTAIILIHRCSGEPATTLVFSESGVYTHYDQFFGSAPVSIGFCGASDTILSLVDYGEFTPEQLVSLAHFCICVEASLHVASAPPTTVRVMPLNSKTYETTVWKVDHTRLPAVGAALTKLFKGPHD